MNVFLDEGCPACAFISVKGFFFMGFEHCGKFVLVEKIISKSGQMA